MRWDPPTFRTVLKLIAALAGSCSLRERGVIGINVHYIKSNDVPFQYINIK
jgi:hypothetical protein